MPERVPTVAIALERGGAPVGTFDAHPLHHLSLGDDVDGHAEHLRTHGGGRASRCVGDAVRDGGRSSASQTPRARALTTSRVER